MGKLDALYDAAIARDADAIAKLEMQAEILNEDDETILHINSRKGNAERVKFILSEFPNKNLLVKLDDRHQTALTKAAYFGHTEVVEILIEAARHLPPSAIDNPVTSFQAFLRHADHRSETALHAAVKQLRLDVVKVLVEADPTDTHIQNNEGKTPMYIAVEQGLKDIVEIISATCTEPSLDGPDGRTVVRVNNLNQVENSGGTFYMMDRDAWYAAAIAGDADAIAKLEMEADILNEDGETILHIESQSGNTERVRFILREFVNKNLLAKLTNSNHTALHLAIYGGHTQVAEVLIDAARQYLSESSFQAFLRQGDKDMDTALHAAVTEGNVAIVKLLVEADPTDTHIQNNPKSGSKTPMFIAVEEGYDDIVEIISTACTAPSLDGPDGSTALRISTLDQVKSHCGQRYEIVDQDYLYDAAIAGDADAIANLEGKANRLFEKEETILHIVSKGGNTEHVKFILKKFANKNLLPKLNKDKRTALHWAIYRGHTEVAEIIFEAARRQLAETSFQAFLRQDDETNNTALHAAVIWGHVAIAKLLVEADPTYRHIQNDDGKTPLYIAADNGKTDTVKMICTACTVSLNFEGPRGSTALHTAIENWSDNIEMIEVLIGAARLLSSASDNDDDNNPSSSFQGLLRQGDEDMNTALHAAVKEGNVAIVKLLVEADPTDTHQKNIYGKTPMYMAVEKGLKDVVEMISTTCTAPSLDGPCGSTALHAAVKNHNHDIELVEVLIDAARRLPYSSSDNDDADPSPVTSLPASSSSSSNSSDNDNTDDDDDDDGTDDNTDDDNDDGTDDNTDDESTDANGIPVSSFEAFLRRGDDDSNTALHIAVIQGNLATAKLLVESDPSDRGIQNNKGETPFYIAAEKGYADIVKMMCTTFTAPLKLDGPGDRLTALHAVTKNLDEAKNEVRDVIKMYIEALKSWLVSQNEEFNEYHIQNVLDAEVFSPIDEQGQTILQVAVERNYVTVVELLLHLQNPVYVDLISLVPLIYKAKDKDYKNMHKLLTQRYEEQAKLLSTYLDNEASQLAMIDSLISAIRSRQTETVFSLLDSNAKYLVTFTDKLGWTALHHAAYHEFNSIINRIVEELKRFNYGFFYEDMAPTPFHAAAEKGYTSTLILLMQLWPSWSSEYTKVDKNGQNILHLAAMQSKKEMVQGILKYCPQEDKNELVNKQDTDGNTPLHVLIRRGCFVPELLRYKGLDTRVKNKSGWTPPDMLYSEDHIIDHQVQIKIALDDIQTEKEVFSSPVFTSKRDAKNAILYEKGKQMKLEKHTQLKKDAHAMASCFADAIAGDPISKAALEMEAEILNKDGKNILHVESIIGNTERVRFIVREFANKSILVKLDTLNQTALYLAAKNGHIQVVDVLIDAARHLPSSSSNDDTENPVTPLQAYIRKDTGPMRNTALHLAVLNCKVAIVKLLIQADPDDNHIQNNDGKTPIYIAAEKGYKNIVKEICTTCTALSLDGPGGRTTALHALIKNIGQVTEGAVDVIRMIIDAAKRWSNSVDFEALFSRTDESGRTVLQLAVERNDVDTVRLILVEDPAHQHGRVIKTNGLMRLIYKAIDNGYSDDIVQLLSQTYKVGISPDHKNAPELILAIKRRDEDSVLLHLGRANDLVSFTEDNGWTALHYAVYHEFDSVLGAIIGAQEDVGHQFVYGEMVPTPFHVAVECGYTSTLIRLMQLWPALSSASETDNSPYTVADKDGRNILHLAAADNGNTRADNRKEMIEGILKYCPEIYKNKMLKQQDSNGDTPLHLLISYGCFIPELIKDEGLDLMAKNKNNLNPWEMLYFKNDVVADQVQIKIAIDGVHNNQSAWNFCTQSTEKKNDIWKNVPQSKRRTKDVIFDERKKSLVDAKHEQKKKDLEKYKMRTNTQIIVAALITTVTFTVGFTMPGGLRQSGEVDEGLVLLSKKKAFNAFMVSDALALLLSTSSLFLYFLESLNDDPHQVSKLNTASAVLNIISVLAMMLTFIAGTYLVLSHSPALAITVCIIGALFFLLIIILLIMIGYDRWYLKRNLD